MASVNGIAASELSKKLATPGATLNKLELKSVLENWRDDFAAALPAHLKNNAEKYAQQVISLVSVNPQLQNCSAVTIISGLLTANSLGLDLNPQLGQCYLIPREVNKKLADGSWKKIREASFQIGYKGALKLAYRSGIVAKVSAYVVHERDYFNFRYGLHEDLDFKPYEGDDDPGEITHVFAMATLVNKTVAFEVWPAAKIYQHALKFSPNAITRDPNTNREIIKPSSVWGKDFEGMAKKTVLVSLLKYLPSSTELVRAESFDGAVRDTLDGIDYDKDGTITIAPLAPDDEPLELPEAKPGVAVKLDLKQEATA